MATQKPTSSTDRALWMIALSLATIAICLVLLVIRQHAPEKEATAQPSPKAVEIKSETTARHIPAIARPKSSHTAISDQDSLPTPMPERVQAGSSPVPEPAVVPVAAKEELPSSTGLAPLTFLETNNAAMITGRVILKGNPPSETRIELDAVCGKLHKTPLTTHRYVVSKDGGLANVLVYIKSGIPRNMFFKRTEPVLLNQTGCQFQPIVLGLMRPQPLIITNSDPLLHNVDASLRDVDSTTIFNVVEPSGKSLTNFFASEGIVRIKCDVHPWMFAYVSVVNNPFFAITDANGSFMITNVPSGNYDLTAMHVQSRLSQTREIVVRDGEATAQDFVIEVEKRISKLER
jgi:hypothetical protein